MSIITAKGAMERARARAKSLVGSSNSAKPFYPDKESSDKVGMRPVSERTFKKGGKVVGKAAGGANKARADRVKRKAGGRIANEIANTNLKDANKERGGKENVGGYKAGGKLGLKKKLLSSAAPAREPAKAVAKAPKPKAPKIEETPVKDAVMSAAAKVAAKAKASKPVDVAAETEPDGDETPEEHEVDDEAVLKRGGRTKKACGGAKTGCRDAAIRGEMGDEGDAPSAADYRKGNLGGGEYALKSGGRAKKFGGGALGGGKKPSKSAKGKTNINIVIASPQGADSAAGQAMPPMAAGPRAVPAPPPMPPMGMPPMGAMPPGGAGGLPPMPPPGGAPPMPRKAGGRIGKSYSSMKAGSGSGLGRLQKQGMN